MLRVLVIDDEQGMRCFLRAVLEHEGYKVITAADGRQGLEQFRQAGAHAVITDLTMPVMNGAEVISRIKTESPETRIVAISGYSEDERVRDVDAFLRKPFMHKDLLRTLARLLAERTEAGGDGVS